MAWPFTYHHTMSTSRVSVIEITFEDGSSDTIQLYPKDGESIAIFGWTRRRKGRKKNSGAYTMPEIATYLYETAYRGESVEHGRFDRLDIELQKAYERCRDSKESAS
jgi:hypothetical protein